MYIQNLRQQKIDLQQERNSLEQENRDLQQERNSLEQEKIDLQMQIRNLKKLIFGTKREYTPQVEMVDNVQCSLFETEEQMDDQRQDAWLRCAAADYSALCDRHF